MENNILKDNREIDIKIETVPTDIYDAPESIPTEQNLSEISEMNSETLTDLPHPNGLPSATAIDKPMITADESTIAPEVTQQSTQAEVTAFVENIKSTTTEIFNNNRQLFIILGWTVLAILGVKIVFAALSIVDEIPLITPIIKLVGLWSVIQFAWRYLIREHDRQELIEILDRAKVEILGDRKTLS